MARCDRDTKYSTPNSTAPQNDRQWCSSEIGSALFVFKSVWTSELPPDGRRTCLADMWSSGTETSFTVEDYPTRVTVWQIKVNT